MPNKTYYKVVAEDDKGHLYSINIYAISDKKSNCIRYKIGERTSGFPGSLGIFVFDSFANASSFTRRYTFLGIKNKIFKVHGHGRPRRPKGITTSSTLILNLILALRKNSAFVNFGRSKTPPPQGTVCFDSITLLEEALRKGEIE